MKQNVSLRSLQKSTLSIAMNHVKDQGERTLISSLAPRFGKTIWGLSLFNELTESLGTKVMILPAYWLGVHSSFSSELSKFNDFADIVPIDASSPDAESIFNATHHAGLRSLILVSLHGQLDQWNEKHRWIEENIDKNEMFIYSDESDFGTHTENQLEKIALFLDDSPDSNQVKMFTSGTNIQRVAKASRKPGAAIFTTYSQLEASGEEGIIPRKFYRLKMDELIDAVESLNEKVRPSWTKIWGKPNANRTFIEKFFKALSGLEQPTHSEELNLSSLTDEPIGCYILLLSANKKEMNQIEKIASGVLPNHDILVLNGDFTTNREAEELTKRQIESAKKSGKDGVIVIANQMGSRSYSISEIQAAVIAYDRGSSDATSQKVSRCLTPGNTYYGTQKQSGHIFDLSFDSNRSENIERLLIEEAVTLTKATTMGFTQAVQFILSTIDVFDVKFGTTVKASEDDLFNLIEDQENLLRVADITADPTLFIDLIDELSDVTGTVSKSKSSSSSKKHKTFSVKNKSTTTTASSANNNDIENKADRELIENAIHTLNYSATTVRMIAGAGETYKDCLKIIIDSQNKSEEFHALYGIIPEVALEILNKNGLNEALLDVIVINSKYWTSPFDEFSKKQTGGMKLIAIQSLGILGKPDPDELWEEIIGHLPDELFLKKDLRILNVASGSCTEADIIVRRMKSLGRSNEEIKNSMFLLDKYEAFTNIAKTKGYTNVIQADFIEWSEKNAMTSKNFDLVIGNPPFSDASSKANNSSNNGFTKAIYPLFTRKSIQISNGIVAMVMPKTNHYLGKTEHNELLKNKATVIKNIDKSVFSSIFLPVWYVIFDKNSNKQQIDNIEWFDDLPVNNQINFQRGKLGITANRHLTERTVMLDEEKDVTIYHKISKRDGLLQYYCDSSDVPLSARFPMDGYAILMPQQMNDSGWSQVQIVKCNGRQAAMSGMNIAFVKTESEAKDLVKTMNTDNFIKQVCKYRGGMNNVSPPALKAATISLDD